VVANYRPGDTIWVQDYQLLLLPELLRQRLPDARIGFFLHIPFPASEVFRMLPWRAQVLKGMLGADLIGFHTPSYARNFASAVVRLLGHEPMFDEVTVEGRAVKFRAYPMGIDAAAFAGPGEPLEQGFHLAEGERLLLGVDRLDYTKGIRRRLTACERVLQRRPDLRGKLRIVQIAVPSRERVGAYEDFRARVEQTIGAINGRWSTLGGAAIHYLYRGFSQEQLISLYRAASVMLVTPLRDGMNLVAKEFAAPASTATACWCSASSRARPRRCPRRCRSTPSTSMAWRRRSSRRSTCRRPSGGRAWRGCTRASRSSTSIAGPRISSRRCRSRAVRRCRWRRD
jgi:trehalose 6-phosphate synthase/phosphatase